MTVTDYSAAIAAAEAQLAEARADVDRLRAALTGEETTRHGYEHRVLTAADGRAEALRRYPRKGTGEGTGEATTRGGAGAGAVAPAVPVDVAAETAADGRAEARRRAGAR